jgi:catechol 2,3-dioxygenase-like lactoylglutathione lyase family enzyme
MFLGSNDIDRSRKFYEAALAPLGLINPLPASEDRLLFKSAPKATAAGDPGANALGFTIGAQMLIVRAPANGEPATVSNGFTIGLEAPDPAAVDAFHAAGLANGGTDAGEPGDRPKGPGRTYAAYLRDPDGHKICANCQKVD